MTPIVTWPTLAAVMNHLWQSTLVLGVAWVVCRTMLTANHARVRYAVWLGASLKFLMPFSLFVEAGRWLRPAAFVTISRTRQVAEFVSSGGGALATSPFSAGVGSQAASTWNVAWPSVLFALWGVGAVCVAAAWIRGWLRVWRAAVGATPSGRFRGVPILSSITMRHDRIEPGVIGIWHPAILLPAGIDERMSEAQMHAVLLHEWHHARRYDNLAAAMQMIVETIFWFHPLVWWLGTRLLEERERACDQHVIEQAAAVDYAEGILNVCRWYSGWPVPCVSGITGADLRARVESVLRAEPPAPLTASRRGILAATLLLVVAVPVLVGRLTESAVFAQAQTANSFLGMATTTAKSFEVATIKLNTAGEDAPWHLGPPGRGSISIANLPLRSIIIQSFRTQRWMVFGGPEWINQERFDIVGKGPDPTATNPDVWEMMRSLLVERFHLKYHIEDRDMAVLALTIAKGGHKLTPGEKGRCADEIKQQRNCGDILIPRFGAAVVNMPIGALVTSLTGRAGRPVVDRTGLTGRYDVNLSWTPEGMTHEQWESLPPEVRPEEMSMFEALERQAGLKLEPTRAPVPVLIIDSVDHPTDN
jgi:bla regulator protein blaR1